MAAYDKDEYFSHELNTNGDRFPKDCFYCGNELFEDASKSTGGVVFWAGKEIISLHQCCAEHLGLHLIQDTRSLASKVKKKSKIKFSEPVVLKNTWYLNS